MAEVVVAEAAMTTKMVTIEEEVVAAEVAEEDMVIEKTEMEAAVVAMAEEVAQEEIEETIAEEVAAAVEAEEATTEVVAPAGTLMAITLSQSSTMNTVSQNHNLLMVELLPMAVLLLIPRTHQLHPTTRTTEEVKSSKFVTTIFLTLPRNRCLLAKDPSSI